MDMALLFPSLLVPCPFLPQGMLEEPGQWSGSGELRLRPPGSPEDLEQVSVRSAMHGSVWAATRVTVTWGRYKSHRNLGNNQRTEGANR